MGVGRESKAVKVRVSMCIKALSEEKLPRAIKIAQRDHQCWKCGALLKPGDKFTMHMDKDSGSFTCYPTCLKCDGRGYDKKYG